jgi:hypothetical protein
MGLDQWWSKGDGVSGKVVHQMVQQAAPLRLTNTDSVPIRTITSGTEALLLSAVDYHPTAVADRSPPQAVREESWWEATCPCSVP